MNFTKVLATLFLLSAPLMASQALAQEDQAAAHASTGQEFLRNGRFKEAVSEFKAAMEIDNNNLGAAKGLGEAAMQLQDWQSAKRGFDTAHRLSKGDCAVTSKLGFVLYKLRDFRRARLLYEEVVGISGRTGCNPGDNYAKSYLARIYMKLRDKELTERAIQLLNQVTSTETEDQGLLVTAHYRLGLLYRRNKSYELAAQNLEQTFLLQPDRSRGRYELGTIHYQQREYGKAIESLEIAIEERKNDYTANLMLGLCYDMKKRRTEAVEMLIKALNLFNAMEDIEREKVSSLPHQALAILYANTGKPSEALKVIQAGLRHARTPSDRAGLVYAKGKAYEKLKRYEEALELFESILDDPKWGRRANREIGRQEKHIQRKRAGH